MSAIVQFGSLEDFIAELRAAEVSPRSNTKIVDKIVRWKVNRMPEQKEAISFQVDAWATAIVAEGESDYLLEFGLIVGRDSLTTESTEGTDAAKRLREQLATACEELGLSLRPGKIEV